MKQLVVDTVPGGNYIHGNRAEGEIRLLNRWRVGSEPPLHGNSTFRMHHYQNHHENMSTAHRNVMSDNVGRENGTAKTLGSHHQQQARINEIGNPRQQQTTQPGLSAFPSESLYTTTTTADHNSHGVIRSQADTKYTQRTGVGAHTASDASRPKLRWQAREPESTVEFRDGPGAASSEAGEAAVAGRACFTDDGGRNWGGGHRSMEDPPPEYGADPSWRGGSGRGGEDRRFDEQVSASLGQHQQQPVRSPSDEDLDMYDHAASVGEYEPSETSSTTTLEEADYNDGSTFVPPGRGGPYGDLTQEMAAAAIARGGARPNLPRSTASSARSTTSEDNYPYSSQTEPMVSPDAPPTRSRMASAARRHSWDERASRLAAAAAAAQPSSRPLQNATSVRRKHSFYEHGNHPGLGAEPLQRYASDPVGHVAGDLLSHQGSGTPPMAGSPFRPSKGYQNQTRYAPSSSPGQRSPSYPVSANSSSRHYLGEHPSQSRTAGLVRYPPLPLPGTLPHVDCQHCRILLMVPSNLAPFKKSTQKLRCGSCRRISIFSVPFEGVEIPSTVSSSSFGSGRSDSYGGGATPLLRAGSDSRPNSMPSGRPSKPAHAADLPKSGRSYSVSEISVGHVNMPPLPRKLSLGNEELKAAAEQHMAERALSETAVDSSYPTPGSSLRSTTSISDVAPSELATEFHNPPAFGTANEAAGGGHDPRFGRRDHGHGAGSGGVGLEEKLTSSDSESDQLRPHVAAGSPQVTPSGSRSSDSISPPLPDGRAIGRAGDHSAAEQAHESRSSLRHLRGIFGSKRGKLQTGHYRRKVVVNGVPIPDHLVKKAEQQAGPIHPGTYWYDWQAGFWGVGGSQCMGIIPPFIEELNIPLSRDCAGGRTGILVNGRELHHVDRDKLASRGLPNISGMSYRIEIDGKVVDESRGTELKSLGRLAPTLEAKGRGSGMFVPPHMAGGNTS